MAPTRKDESHFRKRYSRESVFGSWAKGYLSMSSDTSDSSASFVGDHLPALESRKAEQRRSSHPGHILSIPDKTTQIFINPRSSRAILIDRVRPGTTKILI